MTIQPSNTELIGSQAAVEAELAQHYGDYAGSITRLVAFVIDALIVVILIGIITFIGSFLGDFLRVQNRTLRLLQFATIMISLGVNIGYYVGLWQLAGMTIGKRIMGLIVVAEDGGRITFGKAIRRYVGYYISAILMLGYVWILLDPRRQGWHDKLAGTFVLYDWPERLLAADYMETKTDVEQQEPTRRRRLRRLSDSQAAPAANTDAGTHATAAALTTVE